MNSTRLARLFSSSILVFVCLIWIFPTFRLILFGSKSAESSFEFMVGMIPDCTLLLIVLLSYIYVRSVSRLQSVTAGQAGIDFFKNRSNLVFTIFFVSNVLLGALLSMYPKLILYGFRTTYFSMLFFLVGYGVSKMPRVQAMSLINSVFRISVFFALVGLVLYFFFPNLVKSTIEDTGHQQYEYYIPRMTSVLWTPVLFGFLMAVSSIYFYVRIMTYHKTFDYVCFGILWISLFLSVSRGSLLAFLVIFIIISLYYRKWRTITATVCIIVVSFFLVNVLYFKSGVSLSWMVESTTNTASMTDDISRVERWKLSYAAFLEKPMGYGMGHGGATAYRFLIDSDIKGVPYSTDGWYLKMLCENGVYGLLSALAMALYFFIQLVKSFIRGKLFIHAFAALLLIMVAIHAIPSNTLDYHPYISILWLVLGLGLNTANNQTQT